MSYPCVKFDQYPFSSLGGDMLTSFIDRQIDGRTGLNLYFRIPILKFLWGTKLFTKTCLTYFKISIYESNDSFNF